MRNSRIINRKFFRFLLPIVLSEMAMSLNEFVDSLLVANLIGPEAMALVNMGMPVMLTFAVIYSLLGIGGSAVYAGYLGKYETKKADAAFSVIMLAALFVSVLILIMGFVFMEPLSYFLCSAREYHETFTAYAKVLILSGIFIIPVQVIISFMTAFGHPGTGTFLNIVANVINLIMDYVYIRFFSAGLAGAAYATLTGYVTGLVIILVLCLLKKIRLSFGKPSFHDGKLLTEAASVGLPPSASQIGYCIKISFSNATAFALADMAGTMIFSVCMQAVSIVSVLISGVLSAMVPLASSLYGQRDFTGVKMLIGLVLRVQFVINLVMLLFFEAWPYGILTIYNVPEEVVPMAATGLRIFSLMFVCRGFVLIYMYYFPVIGRKTYALLISLTDGFLGLIPLILILTRLSGINGLWQAYALLSVLLLAAILVVNLMISKKSKGSYSPFLLIEQEDADIPVYECTVKMKSEEISRLSGDVQDFCTGRGVDQKHAVITALAVEEMAVYSSEQSGGTKIEDLDILLKIYPEYILMDFRSIGGPFDISAAPEEYSNLAVLKKIVTKVESNYVLGMNQTRLQIQSP